MVAFSKLAFGLDPLSNDLAEDQQACNLPLAVAPGMHLPAEPDGRTVGPGKSVQVLFFHCPLEAALVNLAPALGQIGKEFIVADPDERPIGQLKVLAPASTDLEITHLAVEHGHGGRTILDEGLEERGKHAMIIPKRKSLTL
ncbi:MAG: hypothetical protein KC910_30990 [Candidatus Eremiobacteraeota bacterium]|nr:hypothetical protein [Candidatus Eremiobacteraeota bacterium]